MPGGFNPLEALTHFFAANTGFGLKGDLVKQVTSYTTLVANQLQNIQLQMDGLTIDYTNSLDEAIKNGSSPSKIKQLTDSYNSTINTLAQSQTDIYNNLVQNYKDAKDAGYYNYTMSNAQNEAITSLYKDTNQAGQAEEVKKLINSMNAADTTKLIIREAVANGTMQLSDIQQYLTEYGNDAKMMSRLGIVTNKFGGNIASQTAMLSSGMNATSANDFSKNIALSKDYSAAQNTLNAIIEARKAGGVGGVGATAKIENFFGKSENLAKLKELGDDLSALKKYKEINIKILGKVYGAAEVAAITKDAKYFNSLNKDNKITYTQTFDTYYNMIGSKEFDQMYISWAAGDGKNEKDKSPTGYVAWLARQATELQKQQDALEGGGGGGGGGEVQASFLDDVVKGIRDNVNGSQKLTLGWTASKKAIQDFFAAGAKGFAGLTQMLTKNKVQDTLMQQMLGLSKEDYEAHKSELVDQYGKLTKFGEQVQRANQMVNIGEYIASQQIATVEAGRQIASLKKLKTAGVDAALAVELMKDKQFALAISGAKQNEVNIIVTKTLKAMKAAYDALSSSEKEQKGIALYQAGLDVIGDKETKINKAYDDRIKALETVSSLNERISAAQQDQMDIAEALSRGDIFAAAKAQKTMIANDAQRAVQASKDMLNAQREQEISDIQVKINGRLETRASLTERIADANSRIHRDTLAQLSQQFYVYLNGTLPETVVKKASGGHIIGSGTGTSDSIPAMLSNGEYVIRANAVKTIGVNTLDKLNQADRMQFSNGGAVGYAAGGLSKYADGGYTDRNNPEYWDARRRYIMHKGEYLWMLAERFLPFQPPGTTLNDFAQQIIASNVNPNSGNPSKLSIGEHVFIPGITDVFPGKSGEPLKLFKKKKPKSKIWGTDVTLGESHYGLGGGTMGGGLLGGMTKMYADGGLVGKADDTAMSNRWMAMGNFFAGKKNTKVVPGSFMNTAGYNAGQKAQKPGKKNPTQEELLNLKPNDPNAPWNKGGWAENGDDPVQRKRYWHQWGYKPSNFKPGDPTSGQVMDVAKTGAYFVPGIAAMTSAGDAATSFGKGDIGGGILNSAFAAGSLWMPGLFKAVGQGLGNVGSFIGSKITTGLGIRGGKNALAALATYADRFYEHGVGMVKGTMGLVDKVKNLTPTLGFNLSDEALHNMLKTGFYGNMRTGTTSSTTDSLMNRIAVEQNMMGIPANATSKQTPAYGFLTTKEDIPVTEGSVWNRGAQTPEQQVINNFNQLINPFSRYLQAYGNNTIKLKPNSLGQATMSMGDSLSIWDQALRLGQRNPGVQKFSSIFSTYPALHGILESTQNLMRKEVPGIKTPTGFPYIEAHLPGGFGIKDIDSIILHPTEKFGPHAKEKIAAELAERKAVLQELFDSLGIKDINIKTNNGMEFIDSTLPVKDPSKYNFMDMVKKLIPQGTRIPQSVIKEQKLEAKNWKSQVMSSAYELLKSGKIVGYQVQDFRNLANVGAKTIRNSLGPVKIKLPEEFAGKFTDYKNLTPEQILQLVYRTPIQSGKLIPESIPPFVTKYGGLNPSNTIFSERPYIKQTNPILDFLWRNGIINTPKGIQNIFSSQMALKDTDHFLPQIGLLPQILYGNKSKRSSYVTNTFNTRVSDSIGNVGNKITDILGKFIPGFKNSMRLGPLSTYISSSGAERQDSILSLFPHEFAHIFDKIRVNAFGKPKGNFLNPSLFGKNYRNTAQSSAQNATLEASAKVTEAQLEKLLGGSGLIHPYTNTYSVQGLMANLQFDKVRPYQTTTDWYTSYLNTIYKARKTTGLPIHTDEEMLAMQQMSRFLKQYAPTKQFLEAPDNLARTDLILTNVNKEIMRLRKIKTNKLTEQEINKLSGLQNIRQLILNTRANIKPGVGAGDRAGLGSSLFGPLNSAVPESLILRTPQKNLGITKKILEDSGEGITPGGFRTINGAQYYVKRPETAAETTGELINSTIWSQLGLGGPKLKMLTGRVLASKIIPDLIKTDRYSLADYIQKSPNKVKAANGLASGLRKYIDEALPTNALLGNWDTHSGNILFNPKTKKFENIDLGITALTTEGRGPVSDLFDNELADRTRHIVAAMKKSGFSLFQINNILKKNGLSKISKKALENSEYGSSYFKKYNLKNLKQEKNLTPQINKIANMLGFDLKKTSSAQVNRAAMNAKTNPFIMNMIKNNPELAQWMKLSPATGSVDGGSLSDGLVSLFFRLKNASMNDSVVKYAKGGLAIPRFKTGGYVGMMPKFADGGLANLHQGEYVFQKSAVDRIGLKNLNAMNQGDTISGDSVYNYSINVNVKSDANANQIADTVLRQIKQIDSQKLRGVRI